MLIVCPSCATSYDVGAASLPPDGRQVRCLRCGAVWHAEPSHGDKLLAAAAAIAPDRGVAAAQPNARPAAETFAAAAGDGAWSLEEPLDDNQAADEGSLARLDDERGSASFAAMDEPVADEANADADADAPSIAPFDEYRSPIDIDAARHAAPAADIETIAALRQPRGAARTASRWPLSRLQTAILALVLVDTILIGWRRDIVRVLPQTASFYASLGMPVNLRGLAFDGVATATEQHEGVPILVVEGNVVNAAHKVADVPRLKFIVRNAARQEIYSWTAVPTRTVLPPGEAVAFRTRLASPPPDAHDLILRFVTRRDLVAGTH
jgi:predicted Zn finger-like uncharacterized protein